MESASVVRVIVIGAGVGGLTAALALQRRGLEVTVHERAGGPAEVGAGISLWGNAIRVFDALGIGDTIRSIGEPLRRGEMRTSCGRLLSAMDMARLDRDLGVTSLILHRAELQTALLEALPRNTVVFDHAFIGCESGADGVTVRFSNGASVRADCAIAADGLRSRGREYVHGASGDELRYSGYTCWRGIVSGQDITRVEPGYVSESWGRGARFGIISMSRDRVYWFATLNAPPFAGGATEIERDRVADVVRDWWGDIPRIVAATRDADLLRHDLYDRVPRRGWSRDRVVLLGDAAHPTTPNVGQGACLAVEDAWVLARELARNAEIADAFMGYESARYERCAEITNFSWRLGKVGQIANPLLCRIRDDVFALTPSRSIAARHARYVGFDVTRE